MRSMLLRAQYNAMTAFLATVYGKVDTATGTEFAAVQTAQINTTACTESWVLRLYLATSITDIAF
jgi:hypothetical protein